MSNDAHRDLWQALREHLQRHVYFLLAAAGASIGFAITQTKDAALGWVHAPLAAGVVLWGVSFYLGCRSLSYTANAIRLNSELIRVSRGEHELAGRDPQKMQFGLSTFANRSKKT
jgi:hypothetical protein